MSITAMKQALEALEWNLPVIEDYGDKEQLNRQHKAITSLYDALRQSIEQAEKQEPVAYPDGDVVGPCICGSWPGGKCLKCPRITPQPQREWVGLTADEQSFVYDQVKQIVDSKPFWVRFADAIEAKLKEKNT